MPGLCGIVGHDLGQWRHLVTEMLTRMKHHPWYQESLYCPPRTRLGMAVLSLGVFDAGEQLARNEDGSLLGMMAGEIYDYAQHRQSLISEGHRFQGNSQAELLLHGFEAQGNRFFHAVHGIFAAVIWDESLQRLIMINDRFGMRPLYYAVLSDRLLFASEIKALLADPNLPRKPCLPGIAQFFRFGQLLGEDTLFDRVRALPPATCLSYTPSEGHVGLERYWSVGMVGRAPITSEAEAMAHLETTFASAVERRIKGVRGLGLSLSGGMDSRTILGGIDHQREAVTAVTLGVEGGLDDSCSRQMAALVGCRYHFQPLTADFLSRFQEHLTSMVHLTDGQLMSQGLTMATLPVFRELNIEVLLRGHGGELLHMRDAYNFSINAQGLAARNGPALEQWLFNRLQTYYGLKPHNGNLFAQRYNSDLNAVARESLRACLRESDSLSDPVQRVSHLFLTQMLPRQCAVAMNKLRSVLEVRLPYLDEDFIDAVLLAPPTLRIDHRVQVHILRKRAPELLQVVNSNTRVHPDASAFRLFLGKLRIRLSEKLGISRRARYSRMELWLRDELRPLVQRIVLSDRCLDRGFFNPNTIRSVVDQHIKGQQDYTNLILALLIFELGQREFVVAS